MKITAAEVAAKVGGEVVGDASMELTGFATAEHAKPGDLTFAEKESYFAAAEKSPASAILVSGEFTSTSKVIIRVANARIAMARLLPLFFPPETYPAGVHPSAIISASAKVDPTAHIGPNVVIGDRVQIGARAALLGGNNIGHDTVIGEDCCLYPNVVVYYNTQIGKRVTIHAGTTIGSDGYSYILDEGRHRKVLQIGNVQIHDDVEIGSNTCIDRSALGSTIIGMGTKIDNLVHIAHNVVIGRHCLIMGQVGFAGSTTLGNYCVIASQAGLAGHLKIGDQGMVGAKTGVMRDVAPGEAVLGVPAQPHLQIKRQWVAVQKLPDLMRRLKAFEKKIDLSS